MKQFYKVFVLVVGLAAAPAVQAQTTFTLQQCIDYALENSVQVQNAKVDEEIAKARVKETIGIGLPQISGSASVTQNQRLQRFFQTKQVFYGFSGFQGDFNDFLPGVENTDIVAAQNFFQLPSSGDASLSVNQILFSGSYLVGLKASSTYKELAYKASNQTKEQVIQQVTKAYYAVLINKERAELFNSNIARVDTLLRNTKALNENGFAENIDVQRIQVTFNNLVTERDKFLNLNLLSVELLKFQMNFPMEQPLEVTGKIEDIEVENVMVEEGWDYKARPDYQVLEVNRKLQELNLKNQYASSLPSLSAFWNGGFMTQANNISGVFKTTSDFSQVPAEQLVTGIGVDKWYDYSMFGLRLSVPLFSGLQSSYKVQQQKLELTKINNNFKTLKSSIDLEVRQSKLMFDNAIKSLASQKENMELAENVARVTKIKYEQGVGSNLEVIDAEAALREAQTNYYNALYDALISKVDLDKAYGKLLPAPTTENK
jgi:outer membrane protein